MFDQLDTAGVGELTPSVIRAGMVRYEMEHITDQDVDQMIRAIDENNDGMVGLSEFNTALARR
jgi:Ca2+-binding EF-hand superfamily protein